MIAVTAVLSIIGAAAGAAAPAAAQARTDADPPAIEYNFEWIAKNRPQDGRVLPPLAYGSGTGHGPFTEELRFGFLAAFSSNDFTGFKIRHNVGPCAGREDRYETPSEVADAPPSWSGTYPTRRGADGCYLEESRSNVEPGVLTVQPWAGTEDAPATGAPVAQVKGYSGSWFWPSSQPSGSLEDCDRVTLRCRSVKIKELDLEYSANTDYQLVLTGYKEQSAANTEPRTPSGKGEILLAEGRIDELESTLNVPFIGDGRLPPSFNVSAQGSLPAYSTIVTEGKDFNATVELRVLDVDAYNNYDQYSTVARTALTDRPAPPTGTPKVGPPTRSGPALGFRPLPGAPVRQVNVTDPPGPVDPTPPGQPDVVTPLPEPPEQLPITGLLNRCSSEVCEVTDLRFPGPTGRVRLVNAKNGTFLGDAEVSGTSGLIYFPPDAQAKPGDLVRAEGFDPRIGEWVRLANTVPVGVTDSLPGYEKAMRCTADNRTLSPRGTCKATIVDTDAAKGTPLKVCLYAVALPGQVGSSEVGCNSTDAAGVVQFPEHGMAAGTEFWVSVVNIPPSTSFDTTRREVFLSGRTLTPRFGRN